MATTAKKPAAKTAAGDLIYVANPSGAVTVRNRPIKQQTDAHGKPKTNPDSSPILTQDYELLELAIRENRLRLVDAKDVDEVAPTLNKPGITYVVKPAVLDGLFPTGADLDAGLDE